MGGNPKVVIPEPDIYCFDLDKEDIDFIILGCDGIYDQLSSQDVFKCAWMMIDYSKNFNLKIKNKEVEKDEIDLYKTCSNIVDLILKASMIRKSFDNVTCLIIAFKDLLNTKNYLSNCNSIQYIKKIENKNKNLEIDSTKPKTSINSSSLILPSLSSPTSSST